MLTNMQFSHLEVNVWPQSLKWLWFYRNWFTLLTRRTTLNISRSYQNVGMAVIHLSFAQLFTLFAPSLRAKRRKGCIFCFCGRCFLGNDTLPLQVECCVSPPLPFINRFRKQNRALAIASVIKGRFLNSFLISFMNKKWKFNGLTWWRWHLWQLFIQISLCDISVVANFRAWRQMCFSHP